MKLLLPATTLLSILVHVAIALPLQAPNAIRATVDAEHEDFEDFSGLRRNARPEALAIDVENFTPTKGTCSWEMRNMHQR